MTDIITHPDGTRTLDLDGETYRAEAGPTGGCDGCAFQPTSRFDDCVQVDCWLDGRPIIWALQP